MILFESSTGSNAGNWGLNMAVTFKDIAEKAGVSYSTVSRVINDHPAVSPDAAETVKRVMKELPNIDIQPEAIGRTAAERLLWRLDNPKEPTQRLLIAPQLDVKP